MTGITNKLKYSENKEKNNFLMLQQHVAKNDCYSVPLKCLSKIFPKKQTI